MRAVAIPPKYSTERRKGRRLLQEFFHFAQSALGMAVGLMVVCRRKLMPDTVLIAPSLEWFLKLGPTIRANADRGAVVDEPLLQNIRECLRIFLW